MKFVITPLVLLLLLPPAPVQTPLPVSKEPYHRVKFENKYVRVLDVVIPPGESTLFHAHTEDMVVVTIADSPTRIEVAGAPPEDSAAGKVGEVWFEAFSKNPVTHKVTNTGGVIKHYVAAELLSRQGGRAHRPSLAHVPGHVLELNNDRVRVRRLVLAPGKSTGTHTHTLRGLMVAVSAGELAIAEPRRKIERLKVEPGKFVWYEGGHRHSLKNVGTAPFEAVDIEFK